MNGEIIISTHTRLAVVKVGVCRIGLIGSHTYDWFVFPLEEFGSHTILRWERNIAEVTKTDWKERVTFHCRQLCIHA